LWIINLFIYLCFFIQNITNTNMTRIEKQKMAHELTRRLLKKKAELLEKRGKLNKISDEIESLKREIQLIESNINSLGK
jgi:predicted  nucleic acid-binding Zn-ribbon protein